MKIGRRDFLKSAGVALAGLFVPRIPVAEPPAQVAAVAQKVELLASGGFIVPQGAISEELIKDAQRFDAMRFIRIMTAFGVDPLSAISTSAACVARVEQSKDGVIWRDGDPAPLRPAADD